MGMLFVWSRLHRALFAPLCLRGVKNEDRKVINKSDQTNRAPIPIGHRQADMSGSELLLCNLIPLACNELSLARSLVNLLKEKNTGTSAIRMTQRVPGSHGPAPVMRRLPPRKVK